MENKKLTVRQWVVLILIGFVGQFAWAIENNEINLWVYSQSQSSDGVNWMTVASAIAATLTTFFMGALSDRLGKRKIFISLGYVLWGVSVFSFALINYDNMSVWAGGNQATTILLVGIMMTVVDCVMTFFGSTANDAAFNAYVTDITNEGNRGKVESILSVLPLFANIVMIGALAVFGINNSASTGTSIQATAEKVAQPWFYFFLVMGILVTVIGILSFFLMEKDTISPNKKGGYLASLIYGFRPSVIKSKKNFYIALLAFMAFNMAMDAFMPYYLIYFTNPIDQGGLGYQGDQQGYFYLAMGIILGLSSLVVILFGLKMDKIGKLKLLLPALAASAVGFLGMALSNNVVLVMIFGTIMMSGYLLGTAVLGATIRDETPKEEIGLFQGVRMVFAVMLPMIIGSSVSNLFFKISGKTYTNDYGESVNAPSAVMFYVALAFVLLAVLPSLWLLKNKKKDSLASPKKNENEAQ
jgi:MFS family permease